VIARHFGVRGMDHCGNCDICAGRTPPRSAAPAALARPADGRAPEDVIIACLLELPYTMSRRRIAQILHGAPTALVGPDRVQTHGALAHLKLAQIERLIDQLTETGYLEPMEAEGRDGRVYLQITLTEKGLRKEPGPLFSAPAAARPGREQRAAHDGGSHNRDGSLIPEDDPRFEERLRLLRGWRTGEAAGKPAYTVFADATLATIAATELASLDDLARIKGVGPAKLERWGAALLDLLAGV
jgi:superfamily II DNA helicase RecQ